MPDESTTKDIAERLRQERVEDEQLLTEAEELLRELDLEHVEERLTGAMWLRAEAETLRDETETLRVDARLLQRVVADSGRLLQSPETRALRRRSAVDRLRADIERVRLARMAAAVGSIRVSIYLTNEEIHEQVEAAVEQWLATADLSIYRRDEPVIASWLRHMGASMKKAAATPAAREALLTATHIADSHLVQAQDAYVTSTLLQNVGPVLQALQPTKDAVVRAGALLIVKIEWVVQVHQLTAVQQAILDHSSQLAASPAEIIAALDLADPLCQEAVLPPAAQRIGSGETATTTAD